MTTAPDEPLSNVAFGWCCDPTRAEDIAGFFATHAGTAYISHSELQVGRAVAADRWSEDLQARIAEEARRAIGTAIEDASAGMRCALVAEGARIAAFAFVRFVPDAPSPFAVLEDLLVDPERRGGGLGQRLLGWIEAECRARGCRRLFLESGVSNHRAHHFFERHGFAQTSVVMMREL